jgi:orotate phosphoribosyltransferase
MTGDEALSLLRARGAVRSGHFQLSSGKHSDTYVEKARVFEDAAATARLGQDIASWFERIDAVISPAVGAIPLGFAVALAGGARSLYAEREAGRMTLRRGFVLRPGERVLVVEDVVTTGGSVAEVWELAGTLQGDRLGVAALVDRSSSPLAFPLRALVRLDVEAVDADACPQCRRGVPVEAPGSRHVA